MIATFIAVALVVGSVVLAWLVKTKRYVFTRTADFGIALCCLSLIAIADSVQGDQFNLKATTTLAIGIGLMVLSRIRTARRRNHAHRHGEPRVIDGSHLRHPSGGKQ